jgi:hypothetical protein
MAQESETVLIVDFDSNRVIKIKAPLEEYGFAVDVVSESHTADAGTQKYYGCLLINTATLKELLALPTQPSAGGSESAPLVLAYGVRGSDKNLPSIFRDFFVFPEQRNDLISAVKVHFNRILISLP